MANLFISDRRKNWPFTQPLAKNLYFFLISPPKVIESRRPRWVWGGLIAILALMIFGGLRLLTPPDGGTPTTTVALVNVVSPTPTASPTDSPSPTPAITPTSDMTATEAALALTPQTTNAAWSPVERTFDDVVMVLVPVGCFMMGSSNYTDEKPIHEQCITAPFWLDKTEVTQAQFVANDGVKANPNRFTGDNRPVEQITWFEAREYCEKRGGRLPTEAEWQFAARGPEGVIYPWGNEFVSDNAVYNYNAKQTAEVGSKPNGVSWVGALDLSGNVWEWTSSLYKRYPYDPTDGREDENNIKDARVLRGGSWNYESYSLRASYRGYSLPDYINDDFGFRCARSS